MTINQSEGLTMRTKTRITDNSRRYEMSNLAEAFTILDIILKTRDSLGLTQLCNCTGFPKNKTFRLLATLEQSGFVERDLQCNYGIGAAALATAQRIITKSATLDTVMPYMRELAGIINESVYFGHYEHGEVVLVDYAPCSQMIQTASFVGRTYKLSERVSATSGNTAGYIGEISVDPGGLDPDVTAITALVFDAQGTGIGALMVIGPSFRMTLERVKSKIVPAFRSVLQRHSLTPPNLKRITSPSYDRPEYRPELKSSSRIS